MAQWIQHLPCKRELALDPQNLCKKLGGNEGCLKSQHLEDEDRIPGASYTDHIGELWVQLETLPQ